MSEARKRGRRPVKRLAAARWLATQPELLAGAGPKMSYNLGDRLHTGVNPKWRDIANAVRREGFFSQTTGTIDIPVARIVAEAMRLRGERIK